MATLDMLALFALCAPQVHPTTLNALIAAESRFQVYAIHVNGAGEIQPAQPSNRTEATALLNQLLSAGKNVDSGLAQINAQNFDTFGLTPDTVFDPCANITAAAQILTANFEKAAQHLPDAQALQAALSAYNTGNETGGLRNGYVQRVQNAATYIVPALQPAPFHTSRRHNTPLTQTQSPDTKLADWSPYRRESARSWDVYARH